MPSPVSIARRRDSEFAFADAESDLADGLRRQPVADEPLPRRAAVGGLPDAAAGAAADAPPGVDLDLPECRRRGCASCSDPSRCRTAPVESFTNRTAVPGLAAVGRADRCRAPAAVRTRGRARRHRRDRDRAGRSTMRAMRPVFSRPARDHVFPASVDLNIPQPSEMWLRMNGSPVPTQTTFGSDGATVDRADRRDGLPVEDRLPVHAAVGRLPESAAGGAGVVDGSDRRSRRRPT